MINNISFIIVAKNEEHGIAKCLASITSMPLQDCEVICVDSDSTDSTLETMQHYATQCNMIQIYQCKGYVNSAIARNAGLKHATKEYIYFIDGDVEVNSGFIVQALEQINSEKAEAVTGQLKEVYYSPGFQKEICIVQDRFSISEEKYVHYSGGNFIVHASLVKKVALWNERLDINEDLDFTLRISRHAPFLAIPVIMGIHHTLPFDERPWIHFKKRYPMYFGMLIRKNLSRPKALLSLLKRNVGPMAGFVVYTLTIVAILLIRFLSLPWFYAAFAISFLVIADLLSGAIRKKNVLSYCIRHYLHTLLIVAGIFFDANNEHPPTVIKRIN